MTTSRNQRDRKSFSAGSGPPLLGNPSVPQQPSATITPLNSNAQPSTIPPSPRKPRTTLDHSNPVQPVRTPSAPPIQPITAPSPAAPSPAQSQTSQQPRPQPRPSINLAGLMPGGNANQTGVWPPGGQTGMPFAIPDEAAIRAATAHMTPEQRDAFVGQQRARIAAMQGAGMIPVQGQPGRRRSMDNGNGQPQPQSQPQQVQQPLSVGLNGSMAPAPSSLPQPPHPTGPPQQQGGAPANIISQRKQFIQSLLSYLKQANLPPPQEIFLAPVPGVIQMGTYTIELVDLFMTIMRQAGGKAGVSSRRIFSIPH